MRNDNGSLGQKQGVTTIGEPYERIGLWGWLGSYATGPILVFFLFSHILLVHYTSSQPITLKSTLLALQSPFVRTVSLGLLLFSVVHGMVGLSRIVLDLELLKRRGTRYLPWCLAVAGAVLFAGGLIIFNQLSSG